MKELRKLVSNLSKIDIHKLINEELKSQDIQKEIIKLIQERLYSKGTDNEGKKFRTDRSQLQRLHHAYADYTVGVKKGEIPRKTGRSFDSRTENVTFNDFGDFYKSFRVKVKKKITEITASFRKKDGHMYENFQLSYSSEEEFENAVANLNNEEIDIICKMLLPKILTKIEVLINV